MFEYEREANPSLFKYIKFGSRMSYGLQKYIECKRKKLKIVGKVEAKGK